MRSKKMPVMVSDDKRPRNRLHKMLLYRGRSLRLRCLCRGRDYFGTVLLLNALAVTWRIVRLKCISSI